MDTQQGTPRTGVQGLGGGRVEVGHVPDSRQPCRAGARGSPVPLLAVVVLFPRRAVGRWTSPAAYAGPSLLDRPSVRPIHGPSKHWASTHSAAPPNASPTPLPPLPPRT